MLRIALLALVILLVAAAAWLYTPDKSRAELEGKYDVQPGDYLDVAGLRLHVKDTGPRDAPALILIHGFGSSLQTWDAWAERLEATHRVIRYDQPGFGLTGPDPTGDYSEARGEAVLLALMDRLGLARATLIGNSLGGKLAWNFALHHAGRVEKLVLISPDGFASKGFEYGKAPEVPLMLRLLPYVLPRPMLRASIAPAYADPARLTDATVDRYYDMMLAPGVRAAIVARMAQVRLEDPAPLLPQIQAPTLLLWGEQDGMIPFRNSEDYLRAMPHVERVALPGLGHVPFEEAPNEALTPVRAFLAP